MMDKVSFLYLADADRRYLLSLVGRVRKFALAAEVEAAGNNHNRAKGLSGNRFWPR
jgi:hypothetical protein